MCLIVVNRVIKKVIKDSWGNYKKNDISSHSHVEGGQVGGLVFVCLCVCLFHFSPSKRGAAGCILPLFADNFGSMDLILVQ